MYQALYRKYRPKDFNSVVGQDAIIKTLKNSIKNRVVIAASMWGKVKTTFQMAMVILLIADIPALEIVTQIAVWGALVLTIVSLVDYLAKNAQLIADYK